MRKLISNGQLIILVDLDRFVFSFCAFNLNFGIFCLYWTVHIEDRKRGEREGVRQATQVPSQNITVDFEFM